MMRQEGLGLSTVVDSKGILFLTQVGSSSEPSWGKYMSEPAPVYLQIWGWEGACVTSTRHQICYT